MSSFKTKASIASPNTTTKELSVWLQSALTPTYKLSTVVALPQEVNTLLRMELMEIAWSSATGLSQLEVNVEANGINIPQIYVKDLECGEQFTHIASDVIVGGNTLILPVEPSLTATSGQILYNYPRIIVDSPASNFNFFRLSVATQQSNIFIASAHAVFRITYYDQSQASLYQKTVQ